MLSKKLLDGLNKQITAEFNAAHLYTAMAAYCTNIDLDGCANFFLQQAEEERFHAMKIFNFIADKDEEVKFGALDNPYNTYDDILDILNAALDHERLVTSLIYDLMSIATSEKEYSTISFLNWFVDEQVEEEAMFNDLIGEFKFAKDDKSALLMLDRELGERVFEVPTEE